MYNKKLASTGLDLVISLINILIAILIVFEIAAVSLAVPRGFVRSEKGNVGRCVTRL